MTTMTACRSAELGLLLLLGAAGPGALAQDNATKNILVFGDSLTWGWVPAEPITRHAPGDRWTAAMAEALGDGYDIAVKGLSARTTNIDDPTDPILNGAGHLPAALASHEPLDLVIIMPGTNDTKTSLDRTPLEIGLGMGELVHILHESPWDFTDYPAPKVLIVSPPPLGATIDPLAAEIFQGGLEKSRELPRVYQTVADMAAESFFDAESAISADGVDGIHFTAETNRTHGQAVAGKVREILE